MAWEPVGRKREFLDINSELHRALGLAPWEDDPFFTDDPEPPKHRRDPYRAELWRPAWELRCALDAASQDALDPADELAAWLQRRLMRPGVNRERVL